ncbi:MAG: glycine/sarcosine/betaine reductase component B subunit [Desulfobulbaceae bacterium]|nr:glycine/sarcosine/betaine reductase component B subunit [Desulfobulbaceae bacterium]
MSLTIGNFHLENIKFADKTNLSSGTLMVDEEAMSAHLLSNDKRLNKVRVELAHPGQSVRIICVKDVLRPWCKVEDQGPGEGVLHVMGNATVITCGKIVGYQEGIIDMSGPGAAYSPFGQTINIVLELEVVEGTTPHQHEEAMREAGLRAAAYLGETMQDLVPDKIDVYPAESADSIDPTLPRIAYIYMLLSQGLLHDTYLFGRNAIEGLPCIIPPTHLLDNGLTSGNCVSACDKNTTWHHQNNPLLAQLLTRHGKDLNFVGVVLTNEPVRLAHKRQSAQRAVELTRTLTPDGVVISKEGFGNPDADQMMLIQGLEQAGIKTCGLTDEYPGPDGCSPSLADVTPQADAMVSTGNANERVLLPPMARTLGPIKDLTLLAGAYPQSLREDGSLEIELQGLVGATNQLGAQFLRCEEV